MTITGQDALFPSINILGQYKTKKSEEDTARELFEFKNNPYYLFSEDGVVGTNYQELLRASRAKISDIPETLKMQGIEALLVPPEQYMGTLSGVGTFTITPAIIAGETIFVSSFLDVTPGAAGEKYYLRTLSILNTGDGYPLWKNSIWGSDTSLVRDNTLNGFIIAWNNSNVTRKTIFTCGYLRFTQQTGAHSWFATYTGQSIIATATSYNVDAIRTHGGSTQIGTSGNISAIKRFESSTTNNGIIHTWTTHFWRMTQTNKATA